MGGGKNSGGSEAAQARADEQQRQARVREGTQRINTIFDGGPVTTRTRVTDLNQAYEAPPASQALAAQFTPPSPSSMADFSGENRNNLPPEAPKQEEKPSDPFAGRALRAGFERDPQTGEIYQVSQTPGQGGFNDQFFQGRRQAYIDYAKPQVDKEYADAQRELTYALARGGNLDSTVRGQKEGDLARLFETRNQQIRDRGLQYETEARNQVENARTDLVRTLTATGDVEGAVNSSQARAAALSQAPAFEPLSNLFADFTSGLGTQYALERADAMSGGGTRFARYNTGLFGNSNNAVQVRGS